MVRAAITKSEPSRELKVLRQRVAEMEVREAEYKKAEQVLRESEQKYRLLSDNVTDIVWIMDIKTQKFDYFSPSVERIRGYTPVEAMEIPLSKTMTPASY